MVVLKIIGLTILLILAIILFLLLLLLFVPFRYELSATKEDGLVVSFKTTWLLKLFGYYLEFKDKVLSSQLRIFFITKKLNKKDQPEEDKTKKKPSDKKKEPREKGPSLFKRIKNLYRHRDAVERLWKRDEEIIKKALLRVKKLLLHLLPYRIKGEVTFGMDEPDTTGKILGAIAVVFSVTGELVTIHPVFDNAVFEPNVYIKGRIRIFTVARLFILLYFNKGLRKTFRHLKKISEME